MERKEKESLHTWKNRHGVAGNSGQGKTAGWAAIVLVLKGRILIAIDNQDRIIKAEEMVLLPSGHSYSYKILEDTQTVSCHFLPEMLAEIIPIQELIYLCPNNESKLTVLHISQPCFRFLRLLEYYREIETIDIRMQAIKRQEFFCLLINIYNKVELAGFLFPVMDERSGFRSFVTGNWKNARNVNELAAMANMSTSGFRKKFLKYFNELPHQWMTRQKAECVREEIISGKSPLKGIVEKYYFASYAHFCSFCKSQYGVLPKVLLNEKNEGGLPKKGKE